MYMAMKKSPLVARSGSPVVVKWKSPPLVDDPPVRSPGW
jgi:hypothetical protein